MTLVDGAEMNESPRPSSMRRSISVVSMAVPGVTRTIIGAVVSIWPDAPDDTTHRPTSRIVAMRLRVGARALIDAGIWRAPQLHLRQVGSLRSHLTFKNGCMGLRDSPKSE